MVFVVPAVSANPAINPIVCGCLSCLRRFRDSRRSREKRRIAKHRFGLNLSAPKSQRFLRFAIAMPIADHRNRSDFPDKTKQCCVAI